MTLTGKSEENFHRALENLRRSLASPITEPRDLSGIIKDFEMAYELSWKVMKKALLNQGHQTLGAKDVFTRAFQLGVIDSQHPWLQMIEDRNQTSHVYDEASAGQIVERIRSTYLALFDGLKVRLQSIK